VPNVHARNPNASNYTANASPMEGYADRSADALAVAILMKGRTMEPWLKRKSK
jgi:hypothetical protein